MKTKKIVNQTNNIAKLHQRAKKIFLDHREIKCPAFEKELIHLNAKGLNHIFYKHPRSGRDTKEIATRVSLLPRAITLLKLMPLPQETDYYERENKKYQFWAFEGVLEEKRIKVIIRQVGRGQKHLWSVIPAWRKSRFGTRINAKTNLHVL